MKGTANDCSLGTGHALAHPQLLQVLHISFSEVRQAVLQHQFDDPSFTSHHMGPCSGPVKLEIALIDELAEGHQLCTRLGRDPDCPFIVQLGSGGAYSELQIDVFFFWQSLAEESRHPHT